VVRAAPGDGGFIVPEELADEPKPKQPDKPAAKSTTDKK
jgi:hypothetical protein